MGYKYKRVYITEKDSQVDALSIVENAKKIGKVAYNADRSIAIVPLQGHLLINEDVKKYAEEFDKFSEDSLKKFPSRLRLRPNPNVKGKLKIAIEHLKEAEEIVIATDFDEEGAAIALNVIEKAGVANRIKFMLEMGSTHPKELRKYIENPTDIPYETMAESARARAWIDFMEGMYFSRALSIYLGNNYETKLNYGGVKAPLTYIVVERDLAFDNHKISYFWTISGIAVFEGKEFSVSIRQRVETKDKKGNKKNTWDNRFETEDQAKEAILALENKDLVVNYFSNTTKKSGPPKLYDLGGIQADMSNKFKVKPSMALELAQKNYDHPVSIQSYPRTEVPYLKETEYEDVSEILRKLKKANIINTKIIDNILSKKIPKRNSTFNDKEVVAHGAIIPTLSGDYKKWTSSLNMLNKEMFFLVAKRYVSNFMEDYKYKSISGETETIEEKYQVVFSENIPLSAGWKEIYEKNIDYSNIEQTIPINLNKGSKIRLKSLSSTKGESKPKPPFTMATLLMAMEKVANLFPDNEKIKKYLKESGIGTPATRSKIIDDVMNVDKNGGEPWLVEKSSKIRSTTKAKEYIKHMPIELVSPIKRAVLTEKLKKISKGELFYEDLILEYRKSLEDNIELIKKIAKENGPIKGSVSNNSNSSESLGKCPKCGGDIIEKSKLYMCNNAKFKKEGENFINTGCDYKIFKSSLSRFGKNNITKTEVKKLLKNKACIVSLVAKGSGKKYSAVIVVDNKWGVQVDFSKKGEL